MFSPSATHPSPSSLSNVPFPAFPSVSSHSATNHLPFLEARKDKELKDEKKPIEARESLEILERTEPCEWSIDSTQNKTNENHDPVDFDSKYRDDQEKAPSDTSGSSSCVSSLPLSSACISSSSTHPAGVKLKPKPIPPRPKTSPRFVLSLCIFIVFILDRFNIFIRILPRKQERTPLYNLHAQQQKQQNPTFNPHRIHCQQRVVQHPFRPCRWFIVFFVRTDRTEQTDNVFIQDEKQQIALNIVDRKYNLFVTGFFSFSCPIGFQVVLEWASRFWSSGSFNFFEKAIEIFTCVRQRELQRLILVWCTIHPFISDK